MPLFKELRIKDILAPVLCYQEFPGLGATEKKGKELIRHSVITQISLTRRNSTQFDKTNLDNVT